MTSDKLLAHFQRQCSRCECCSSDIMDRAVRLMMSESRKTGTVASYESAFETAGQILSSLLADGFVDDLRYASSFAREKSSLAGWGPVKIRQALKIKKIDGDIIEKAILGIDSSRAGARLEKLLESKWKVFECDPQGKLKLIRFALGRGYDYDTISGLVEDITSPRR